MNRYRVWPNGTVQPVDECPYDWMSDDFMIIVADSEEHAWELHETLAYRVA